MDIREISVTADDVFSHGGQSEIGIKLQGFEFELNVSIPREHIARLRELPRWESGALPIGTVSGVTAFWSCDDHRVSVLVGPDDQCWEFGVWFDESTLARILEDAEGALAPAAEPAE